MEKQLNELKITVEAKWGETDGETVDFPGAFFGFPESGSMEHLAGETGALTHFSGSYFRGKIRVANILGLVFFLSGGNQLLQGTNYSRRKVL